MHDQKICAELDRVVDSASHGDPNAFSQASNALGELLYQQEGPLDSTSFDAILRVFRLPSVRSMEDFNFLWSSIAYLSQCNPERKEEIELFVRDELERSFAEIRSTLEQGSSFSAGTIEPFDTILSVALSMGKENAELRAEYETCIVENLRAILEPGLMNQSTESSKVLDELLFHGNGLSQEAQQNIGEMLGELFMHSYSVIAEGAAYFIAEVMQPEET